jgi:hypothetical protein
VLNTNQSINQPTAIGKSKGKMPLLTPPSSHQLIFLSPISFNQHSASNFSSGEAKQFYIYCKVNNKLFDIYLTTEVKDSK